MAYDYGATQAGDWLSGNQYDENGRAIASDPSHLNTIGGVAQQANYGPYFQQLLDQGVISKDRMMSGSATYGGQGQQWFPGNDGNIYLVDGTGNRPITRIPASNIDPSTGKDKVGSVSDFLDPNTGAVTGQGQANFAKIDPGEMIALASIAAMAGGAALTGTGVIGGGAAGAGGVGSSGAAAAASPWESGLLASGVEVGGPMSVGLPVGVDLPAMGAMAGAGGAIGASAGSGSGLLGGGVEVGGPMSTGLPAGTALPGMGSMAGAGAAAGLGGVGSGVGGLGSLLGGSGLIGPAVTALGGLLGSQAQNQTQTSTRAMDPRVGQSVYNNLLPQTDALLNSQGPTAQQYGQQMGAVGQGLLNTQITPDFASNPYMQATANDLQRRTSDLLGQNNQQIAGNAVANGGLGGSRQGVAQGLAASKAADSLQGNLANMYMGQYNTDANRNLQQVTLGAGLMGQGLNTSWQPVQNATAAYSPFTGYGTTTQNAQQGGGAMGALGGALGAAQLGKNLGFWGSSGTGATSSSGMTGNLFGSGGASGAMSNPWGFSNNFSWS